MTKLTYHVGVHDGGYGYRLGDVWYMARLIGSADLSKIALGPIPIPRSSQRFLLMPVSTSQG